MQKVSEFQRAASTQGKLWHNNCIQGLELSGFSIVDNGVRLNHVGIEIDIVARNRYDVLFFFECKGSMRGDRPGCIRTDTLKKAIANGYLFTYTSEYQTSPPLVLLASHIPTDGAGYAMLRTIDRSIFFDVLNPWQHNVRLKWMAESDPEELQIDMDTPLDILLQEQWCI